MVVIDTDVLLLAFAFQNDKRQAVNAAFLDNEANDGLHKTPRSLH